LPESKNWGSSASTAAATYGKPKGGTGVKASLLGTTTRSDGNPEVTYNGHPLYYYAGDRKAGDTNGQDLNQFGAPWYVVSPAGNKTGH
jgi:predicted lipoprotein with Yx(FWY)xxD motif